MRPAFIFVLSLSACAVVREPSSAEEKYFMTEVKPVFEQHCLRCHNGSLPKPALNLNSKATAFQRTAKGESYLVPGHPDKSLLITAVQRGGTHAKMMPRTDLSLTEDQIGELREWIEDGAFWPEGDKGVLKAVKGPEGF